MPHRWSALPYIISGTELTIAETVSREMAATPYLGVSTTLTNPQSGQRTHRPHRGANSELDLVTSFQEINHRRQRRPLRYANVHLSSHRRIATDPTVVRRSFKKSSNNRRSNLGTLLFLMSCRRRLCATLIKALSLSRLSKDAILFFV